MLTIATLIVMPIIATVAGAKLYMYFKDHNPPHFHARDDGEEEVFDLEGKSLRGRIDPKKGKEVKKWAGENEQFLKEKWNEFQQ